MSYLFGTAGFNLHNKNVHAMSLFSQYAEWILNKITKAINETFTGLMCMVRGSEYILYEILALRA